MDTETTGREAAVAGLNRSDPRSPGITRQPAGDGFAYTGPDGAPVTDPATLNRIRALVLPPAWRQVWISPDPLGHIQATGIDRRGRTQYRYHDRWREHRDEQKFAHMLRFAVALPGLRDATLHDLRRRPLSRDRVVATAVRLLDLGLFRIGGERYAELDHHYGVTTLEKRHVAVGRSAVTFDYVAKEGKRREITVTDRAILPTLRTLADAGNDLDSLFAWEAGGAWRPLHSHDVSAYIADRAGAHFTAKEFRTWNATVLMALLLAGAEPAASGRARQRIITTSVKGVAGWLGDTPTVARSSYIDPRLITRYQADGALSSIPPGPAELPAAVEAEAAVHALLSEPPVRA
ncbi:MAG: DNA topoisomerase IB [Actinobacteria bacterium]|nr:DNA topoisomerase IB [Actinomycetota bacterium]